MEVEGGEGSRKGFHAGEAESNVRDRSQQSGDGPEVGAANPKGLQGVRGVNELWVPEEASEGVQGLIEQARALIDRTDVETAQERIAKASMPAVVSKLGGEKPLEMAVKEGNDRMEELAVLRDTLAPFSGPDEDADGGGGGVRGGDIGSNEELAALQAELAKVREGALAKAAMIEAHSRGAGSGGSAAGGVGGGADASGVTESVSGDVGFGGEGGVFTPIKGAPGGDGREPDDALSPHHKEHVAKKTRLQEDLERLQQLSAEIKNLPKVAAASRGKEASPSQTKAELDQRLLQMKQQLKGFGKKQGGGALETLAAQRSEVQADLARLRGQLNSVVATAKPPNEEEDQGVVVEGGMGEEADAGGQGEEEGELGGGGGEDGGMPEGEGGEAVVGGELVEEGGGGKEEVGGDGVSASSQRVSREWHGADAFNSSAMVNKNIDITFAGSSSFDNKQDSSSFIQRLGSDPFVDRSGLDDTSSHQSESKSAGKGSEPRGEKPGSKPRSRRPSIQDLGQEIAGAVFENVSFVKGVLVGGPCGLFYGIRKLVSGEKQRFEGQGFNLDLSYITDELIAMGYPAEKTLVERASRNHIDEVLAFFRMKHPRRVKIFNLIKETQIASYDLQKFISQGYPVTKEYAFFDHSVPPLEILDEAVEDMQEWVGKGGSYVAAVHCKAGKGRTGVLVCCFLCEQSRLSATEAITMYGVKRMRKGRGLTVPSQRRWVHYFEARRSKIRNNNFEIKEVSFREGIFGSRFGKYRLKVHCHVWNYTKNGDTLTKSWDTIEVFLSETITPDDHGNIVFNKWNTPGKGLIVEGGFSLTICMKPKEKFVEGPSCWLHAGHLPESVHLAANEWDGTKTSKSLKSSQIHPKTSECANAWEVKLKGVSTDQSPDFE